MTGQLQHDGGSDASNEVTYHDGGGPEELVLEIDGPGLHPSSVDALSFLELASAYFALVAAVAAKAGYTLRLEGLEVRDKCAGLVVQTSNGPIAKQSAMQTVRVLRNEAAPPRGGADHVRRFQKAARLYNEPGHSIAAIGTNWKMPIAVSRETRPRPMDSLETLRVKTQRVGGREPSVRFSSVLEREEFTLHAASEDLARALGNQLYREVEIQAMIERARDGTIVSGKVLAFEPLDASGDDPWSAWEQWHQVPPVPPHE